MLRSDYAVLLLLDVFSSQSDVNTAGNDSVTAAADNGKDKSHSKPTINQKTPQPSVASVTSSLSASNITDDTKVYGKFYMYNYFILSTVM